MRSPTDYDKIVIKITKNGIDRILTFQASIKAIFDLLIFYYFIVALLPLSPFPVGKIA